MSTKTEVAEGKETTINATVTKPVQKYEVAKLRENCLKLFGVTISTFDGATYGMTGEYTVEEIKTTLEKWGKMEAK